MNTWKKYNGALISNHPPHLVLDTSNITFLIRKQKAFFARWITDFDCEEELPFWYVIKDKHTPINAYSASVRNQIRKGLKNCIVKQINKDDVINYCYNIYYLAFKSYNTFNRPLSKKVFLKQIMSLDDTYDFWGIYHNEMLIGYSKNRIYKNNICEFCSTKFHPDFLKFRPSEALFYTMSEYYLGQKKFQYIYNGTRPLLHHTNIQDFLIKKIQFRKAYCRLHIKYNPLVKFIVYMLFPIRKYIKIVPSLLFKKVSVVLFQEWLKRFSDCIVKQKKESKSLLIFSNGNFKSGSTWVTAIINELLQNKKHIFPQPYRNPKYQNWINRYKIADFINSQEFISKAVWVSKSHIYQNKLIFDLLQYQRNIKVVNIERNLKDVIVSHYFHLLNSGKIKEGFSTYFNKWGKYKAIQYMQYNRAWQQYDFCLKLKYEDLKSSPESVIKKIADYLGINNYDINNIINETHIDVLRKMSKQKDLNEQDWFFRKGMVGEGDQYFTKSMKDKLKDIKDDKISSLESFYFFFKFSLRLRIKYFLYKFLPPLYILFDKKY